MVTKEIVTIQLFFFLTFKLLSSLCETEGLSLLHPLVSRDVHSEGWDWSVVRRNV